jgi:hypothetical protein
MLRSLLKGALMDFEDITMKLLDGIITMASKIDAIGLE